MKTLIKSTLIASALFTTSLMAATEHDSSLMSHPVEGIMGFGEVTHQVSSSFSGFDKTIDLHPIQGSYMQAPTASPLAKTHCIYDVMEPLVSFHSTERLMGVTNLQC